MMRSARLRVILESYSRKTEEGCMSSNLNNVGNRPVRHWIVRSRAWMSILILTPFAVLAALSQPLIKEDTVADFLLDAMGWTCFFVGAVFRWWAVLYVGGRKGKELAVEGPYSITRNPLYFGTFLLALSLAFFLHSVLFAIGLMLAVPMYLWITIPWEEERLLEKFGDSFAAYRHRVSKFLPHFSKIQSPPTLQVNVTGLIGELQIAARWIWIPILAEGFAHLRMAPWWPLWFRFP